MTIPDHNSVSCEIHGPNNGHYPAGELTLIIVIVASAISYIIISFSIGERNRCDYGVKAGPQCRPRDTPRPCGAGPAA